MIYFVDEDECQLQPFLLELDLRGLKSQHLLNADDFLAQLDNVSPADYLFIDVMLAASPDEGQSAFSREVTQDYKITGLCLATEIRRRRPDIPVDHIVLMSQAASRGMRSAIDSYTKSNKMRFIAKSAYDDPMAFGDEVERFLREA